MKADLVSILIPVYNRESLIRSTVASALAQTHRYLEVIVVDNASTDRTWQVLTDLAETDARLKIFRNAENLGPVRNWLACVEKATGAYAKILWSDDLIHPQFVERLLPYMADPEVGFAYSAVREFEGDDPEVGRLHYATRPTGVLDSHDFVQGLLLGGDFPVSPGCALFRTPDLKRNLLLHVPNGVGSDFSMHAIGNDLLLFLLTAREYRKIAMVAEVLSYFRAHQGSITVSSSAGKIPLHYDLAKGYFADNYISDQALRRRLNAVFLLHMARFKAKQFGIRSLSDFYPSKQTAGFDMGFLIYQLIRGVARRIAN